MKLPGAPRCMAASPDGALVALGDYNGTVRVMNHTTGKLVWKLRPGDGRPAERAVSFMAWSPGGESIAWSSNRRLYVASAHDGSLRWERRAAQRTYASVPVAWRPDGNSVFWMSDEALHEVSAGDGGPLGDTPFDAPGEGAMRLCVDAASALVACRARFSAPWVIVDAEARRTVAQLVTPERREPGTRAYEALGGFVGAGRFAVFHCTTGRYVFDAATGRCLLHWPHTPVGGRAWAVGEGSDGASPWMVHPAPEVNTELGIPENAMLVAWNTTEDRSVALDAVVRAGLYAVIPGQRRVLYNAPLGRGALRVCAW